MADEYGAEHTDHQEEDSQVTLPRSQIRHLEEQAKKARQLEKEQAFRKAGLDPDAGPAKLLFNQYDDELDPDTIKSHADEFGITATTSEGSTPMNEGPTFSEQEQTMASTRRNLASNATPDDGSGEHPSATARREYEQSVERGASRDDALAGAFSTLASSAAQGDSRVLYRP